MSTATLTDQLALVAPAAVAVHEVDRAEGNRLLDDLGHYLGPCHRPFGQQAWALVVAGRPLAVAVSASTVSSTVRADDGRTWQRTELVELARLAAAERWATRVMLRLWREALAPPWPPMAPRLDCSCFRCIDHRTELAANAARLLGKLHTRTRADTSWQARANCIGVDPDLFFPEHGESLAPAKAVCSGCEVRAECLDYALATGQHHGVWGGTSERERKRTRKAGNESEAA